MMCLVFNFFILTVSSFVRPALSMTDSNDQDESPRMWGGSRTTYEKYPYFAAITYRKSSGMWYPVCGGAFVTPQMVLTAAHCIKSTSEMQIRYGTDESKETKGDNNRFGPGYDYRVTGAYKHPAYVDRNGPLTISQSADIALVRLDVPINHTDFVIKLPDPGEDAKYIDNYETCTLVAMGSSFGRDTGNVLKDTQIRLYRRGCADSITDTTYKICAKGDDGDWRVCPGDSGSPVLRKTDRGHVIIAVATNTVYQCTEVGYRFQEGLSKFALVSSAMKWILKTIQEQTLNHHLEDLATKWQSSS